MRIREEKGIQAKPDRVEVVCQICGKGTLRAPSTAAQGGKYCSRECMGKGKRRPATFVCMGCGSRIETNASGAATHKYCSWECYKATKELLINCEVCGKERRVTKQQLKLGARFCSWSCASIHKLKHGVLASPTSIELLLYAALDELGTTYVRQYRIPEARTIPDAYVSEHRLVIYADGEYWHSLPKIAARDARQNARLAELGYTVRRLSEADLRRNALETVRTALSI